MITETFIKTRINLFMGWLKSGSSFGYAENFVHPYFDKKGLQSILRQLKILPSLTKKIMQLLERTEQYEIYLDFFEGITVRIKKDIKTGEVLFFAEDVAKVLDYESLEVMMGSDEVLDIMNEEHRRTGVFPISVQNF